MTVVGYIVVAVFTGGGIFIGVQAYLNKKKKDKEAKRLEFVIGPITLK